MDDTMNSTETEGNAIYLYEELKKYGSYVELNLLSGCQTQEKSCIDYPLIKERRKFI